MIKPTNIKTMFADIFPQVDLNQPQIMGIVNVTPDSFSDGGRYTTVDLAIKQALALEKEGATFIDLGGESTRPGAEGVAEQEELDRVLPVLEGLRKESAVMISIDTSNPKLMQEAAKLGANLLNDVRSFTREGALEAAQATGLPVCIMHMRGEPSSMQQQTTYADVVTEVKDWLVKRMQVCIAAGIAEDKILLDPGFGFAKLLPHNLTLLANLNKLTSLNRPLLVGMSRKRMLGEITGKPALERDAAGIAAHLLAAQQGAKILRVHSVAGLKDALQVWQATAQALNLTKTQDK
ncbi:dihydropteroate synthase [Marinospirillum minutulum]|uniref:dihydropteroate synthase n=1 Tax=Marinospirillum minutulum TaxID=64974 RepID=UPI0004207B88|nr:dihydropteroate synthase [Marinospirillum minutulum]